MFFFDECYFGEVNNTRLWVIGELGGELWVIVGGY